MTNGPNKDDRNDDDLDFSKGIPNFILKTVIITIGVIFAISVLTPELPKIPETEKNKLILLSFVQNPNILWRLSSLEEEKGNIKNASSYLEAAIGLLEMNGASDKSLKKYQERLEKLNSKRVDSPHSPIDRIL